MLGLSLLLDPTNSKLIHIKRLRARRAGSQQPRFLLDAKKRLFHTTSLHLSYHSYRLRHN